MNRSIAPSVWTGPRRPGAALTYDECLERLADGYTGRLGYVVDGEPRIVPVNYRWWHDAVHVRARPSEKLEVAGSPGAVLALQIDEVDDLYHRGWSVLVVGPCRVTDDPGGRVGVHPWVGESDDDRWIVIEPRRITGRVV